MNAPYIDFHTHNLPATGNIIAIYNVFHNEPVPAYPYYSTGIHPWHVKDWKENDWDIFIEKIPGALAVGECGMDFHPRHAAHRELQKELFLRQIQLSERYSKPLIIHCVRCYDELKKMRSLATMPWIVHGYNKSYELARELTEKYGMFLSFGAALLHPGGRNADVFRQVPLEFVLLETDDKPVSIKEIYERAAGLKDMDTEALKSHMHRQFGKIFKKSVFSQ